MTKIASSILLIYSCLGFCVRRFVPVKIEFNWLMSFAYFGGFFIILLFCQESYRTAQMITIYSAVAVSAISASFGNDCHVKSRIFDLLFIVGGIGIYESLRSTSIIEIWLGTEIFFFSVYCLILNIPNISRERANKVNATFAIFSAVSWAGIAIMYEMILCWSINEQTRIAISAIDPPPVLFCIGISLFLVGYALRAPISSLLLGGDNNYVPPVLLGGVSALAPLISYKLYYMLFDGFWSSPVLTIWQSNFIWIVLIASIILLIIEIRLKNVGSTFYAQLLDSVLNPLLIAIGILDQEMVYMISISIIGFGISRALSSCKYERSFEKYGAINRALIFIGKIIFPLNAMGLPPSPVFCTRLLYVLVAFSHSFRVGFFVLVMIVAIYCQCFLEKNLVSVADHSQSELTISEFVTLKYIISISFVLFSWFIAARLLATNAAKLIDNFT